MCGLKVTPEAPGIPFCSVNYTPPLGTLPAVTAVYSGDGAHAGSEGRTELLNTPIEEVSEKARGATPRKLPGEVDVDVDVTTSGTTAEADVTDAETPVEVAPGTEVERALEGLPKIDVEDPKLRAGLEELEVALKAIPSASARQAAMDKVSQLLQQLYASANAAEDAAQAAGETGKLEDIDKAGKLLQDLNTTYHTVKEDLEGRTPAGKQGEKKPGQKAAAALAGAFRRHGSRGRLPLRLGSSVRRNAPVGRLRLRVHLDRSLLAQAAGGHRSLSVWVWLNVIPPRTVNPHGLTITTVRRLLLRRR